MALQKVRGYRNMMGYSQKELAEILGITKQSYSNKERGVTAFTIIEMKKFKELLEKSIPDITIDHIFFN